MRQPFDAAFAKETLLSWWGSVFNSPDEVYLKLGDFLIKKMQAPHNILVLK